MASRARPYSAVPSLTTKHRCARSHQSRLAWCAFSTDHANELESASRQCTLQTLNILVLRSQLISSNSVSQGTPFDTAGSQRSGRVKRCGFGYTPLPDFHCGIGLISLSKSRRRLITTSRFRRTDLSKRGWPVPNCCPNSYCRLGGYKVHGIPVLVLIGTDGKVKNYWEGEVSKPDLEAAIQQASQHQYLIKR